MKIALIIILVLYFLYKVLTNTRVYHEAVLLTEVRKNINMQSLMRGVIMNDIKSRACYQMLAGKISEEFYRKIFSGGDAKTPWWEVNRKNIEG